MTFDPRSKARKAAMELRAADAMTPAAADAIESALLAFAKEVLTQEPDAEMHRAGLREEDKVWPTYDYTEGCALKVWHAMSAHRAKSLEDGE